MQRELFLDTKLHTENFLTAFGCAISGIVLIILKPLFGFDITWRRLVIPSSIVFWGGLSIFVCSILFFIIMEKIQPMCLRCKRGLVEGEADFPDESTDCVYTALRTASPPALAPLLSLRPGSLLNTGASLEFMYCPACRTVGELTACVPARNYRTRGQILVGESAQMLAYLCDIQKQIRECNNNKRIGA